MNKRKKEKIILMFMTLIVFTHLVSAITIDINMKESFGVGEEIYFDYTITSEISREIEYAASVDCPSAPLALLDVKTTSLEAGVPFTEKKIYMSSVDESIEPQICEAMVGISDPETLEQKSFSIVTAPSFDFDVDLDKSVFVKGEEIEIGFISGISPIATAVLIYPNKRTQQLTLPATIIAEQIGTYDLEVTVSKQGYKTLVKEVQFGVIRRAANIDYTTLAVGGRSKSNAGKYLLFVLLGVIFVLVVVICIKIFKRLEKRRRRKGKLDVEKELKRGLKKKVKKIEKSKRSLFRRLFRRKRKLPQGKKQEVDKKISQEKKVLTRQKVGARKEFVKKLGKEKKELQMREKRVGAQEKKNEIRRLLSKGRRQLSNGNRWGAKNTYHRLRLIHASLKPGEKNRELYNELLIFHERLKKPKKKEKK